MRDARWAVAEEAVRWAKRRKVLWRQEIETSLSEEGGAEPSGKKEDDEKQWKRLASFDLVCGVDRQFVITTGQGLNVLEEQESEERPIYARPHLTISWDTGPDNVCASSYLLNKKSLRTSICWDPLHKVWRVIWNGTRVAGLFSVVLLGAIVANLDRGPWNGEANYEVEIQAAKVLASQDLRDGPLVRMPLPRRLRDRGGRS